MGASGADVARKSATTDDSAASIVAVVEERRVIHHDLRKSITYGFAHTTPEGIPLAGVRARQRRDVPTARRRQILAVDLGTKTLPAPGLGHGTARARRQCASYPAPGHRLIDHGS